MAVTKELFGKLKDGSEVYKFSIENKNGMKAVVTNLGAILVNLYVPDKKGKIADVVIGYDKLHMYVMNSCFFGCTVGPIANRIGKAQYKLDGKTVKMEVNDHKVNNLHSSLKKGFQKRLWDAETGKDSVTFSLTKKDGDLCPGKMKVSVTYTLTSKNELKLTYHADSDKKAVINMTNHSYFNLSGQKSNSILDTKVKIHADQITETDRYLIPTGNMLDVKGTPADFTEFKKIGKDIDRVDFKPVKYAHGFDFNYAIKGYNGKKKLAAEVEDPKSGRRMEVYTDLPGLQFYTGAWIKDTAGKEGYRNGKNKGFCLETQYFPDAINHDNFVQPVFGSGKDYYTETVYRFYW